MTSTTQHSGRRDGAAQGAPIVRDHVIGVDLGGTKIRAGIATATGDLLAEKRIETSADGSEAVEQIHALALELCETVGVTLDRVLATGVGGAGVPDAEGTSFDLAPNLTALGGVPFRTRLAALLGHPVVIENDVNVSAVGELVAGLGRGLTDFVFISVGTGIGMGVIANGVLLRGARGAAGEIGFLPLGADPLDPAHHVRGALEEVTAGDAVSGRFLLGPRPDARPDAGPDRPGTGTGHPGTGSGVSAEEVFALAAAGDARAVNAVDEEARWLAAGIAAVTAVLDPELVILGGGIGARPDLVPRVTSWLARYGQPHVPVRISQLGPLAPVIGAAEIARHAAAAAEKGLSR
ncbi:ROK family protein [Herbiconiux sp.]|uniref:ROK family protein n=1 Tax=Herbiconiux sp. TaxID=1871186 RepID=UPI0025BA8FC3|nr:ROK family protein [Herbiconiux sp.]